jgi:mevalonate kinase
MRNEKEIEEAAKNYGRKFYKSTHPDAMIEVHENFIAGAQWMKKDLLESASEGFEEWFDKNFKRPTLDYELETMDQVYSAWVASELKNQKIIQEKDEKYKQAVKDIKYLLGTIDNLLPDVMDCEDEDETEEFEVKRKEIRKRHRISEE